MEFKNLFVFLASFSSTSHILSFGLTNLYLFKFYIFITRKPKLWGRNIPYVSSSLKEGILTVLIQFEGFPWKQNQHISRCIYWKKLLLAQLVNLLLFSQEGPDCSHTMTDEQDVHWAAQPRSLWDRLPGQAVSLTYPAELKQHRALGMCPILHTTCPEGFPPWDADCGLLLFKKYQGCFLKSLRTSPIPKHICTAYWLCQLGLTLPVRGTPAGLNILQSFALAQKFARFLAVGSLPPSAGSPVSQGLWFEFTSDLGECPRLRENG